MAMILFLALLFGIFLSRTAERLALKTPVNRPLALGGIVLVGGIGLFGGLGLFAMQVNSRVEATSQQIDSGLSTLRKTVAENPTFASVMKSTPFVSSLLENEFQSESAQGDSESSRDDSAESAEHSAQRQDPSTESSLTLGQLSSPARRIASAIGKLFQTTFGLLVNSLLIFFVGLFLASSPDLYRDGAIRLVPKNRRDRARQVIDSVGDTLWRWLLGRFATMTITGLGAFLLLLLAGVPMAGTLGIVTALLTFIPNIGAAISLVLALLCALPEGLSTTLVVLAGYVALQLIESYLVTPLIQQQQVALPPAMLISFQAVMGVVFGFLGAAIASPLLAMLTKMIQMVYVEDYLGDNANA